MAKKLAGMGLVAHAPYRGMELTPVGEKVALEVVRHHRLIETYLAQVLGVPWEQVHEEAERWEHVISEDVEARMAEALNHPTHDPHGAPIPSVDGVVEKESLVPLGDVPEGGERQVRRVNDDDAAVLRHLREVGLVPGARVIVLRAAPEEGVLRLRVNGSEQIIGAAPASAVFVSEENN
jgi:DtxR family Mn-dependent transcriptional regulator